MSGSEPRPKVQKTGYVGFGSFHSDNVEVLVALPADHYVPPTPPFPLPHVFSCLAPLGTGQPASLDDSTANASTDQDAPSSAGGPASERSSSHAGASAGPTSQHAPLVAGAPAFGKACRELFLIDFQQWTFLNHGAFGGVCKPAYLEADLWRRHCEAQPLNFLDRYCPAMHTYTGAHCLHKHTRAPCLSPSQPLGMGASGGNGSCGGRARRVCMLLWSAEPHPTPAMPRPHAGSSSRRWCGSCARWRRS